MATFQTSERGHGETSEGWNDVRQGADCQARLDPAVHKKLVALGWAALRPQCIPQPAQRGMSQWSLSVTLGASTRACVLANGPEGALADLVEKAENAICNVP